MIPTNPIPTARLYLIRHATPDWSRQDIPYAIPPGPPLTPQGEAEAAQLGEFLRQAGVRKLYHSPLERAKRTAGIAAGVVGIPIQLAPEIAEFRPGETDAQVAARFLPFWERVMVESSRIGPIGLVTHGGPVRVMLLELGLRADLIESYNQRFDGQNPIPPAGAWLAERCAGEAAWRLQCVYVPEMWEGKQEKETQRKSQGSV